MQRVQVFATALSVICLGVAVVSSCAPSSGEPALTATRSSVPTRTASTNEESEQDAGDCGRLRILLKRALARRDSYGDDFDHGEHEGRSHDAVETGNRQRPSGRT